MSTWTTTTNTTHTVTHRRVLPMPGGGEVSLAINTTDGGATVGVCWHPGAWRSTTVLSSPTGASLPAAVDSARADLEAVIAAAQAALAALDIQMPETEEVA